MSSLEIRYCQSPYALCQEKEQDVTTWSMSRKWLCLAKPPFTEWLTNYHLEQTGGNTLPNERQKITIIQALSEGHHGASQKLLLVTFYDVT